jgi:MarR family transcriptional regulator, lower aerobic nicotinate degradation pathway regulator
MSKRSDIDFIMESVHRRSSRLKKTEKQSISAHRLTESQERNVERYDVTKQPGHLLRKALQHHLAIFQRLSPEPSVTGPQFALLCALRDHGPCSLTEIGRVIVMDPATTRGIAVRLRHRGFISLSPDVTDRRQVIVALEQAGARILRRMIPAAIEVSAATVENLNAAEQIALQFLLEKMVSSKNDGKRTAPGHEVNGNITGRQGHSPKE